jgi:hypothetical protein
VSCLENGHLYSLAGLVWSEGGHRPGTSARDILYEDKFYCQRCLDVQYRNPRAVGNSYGGRIDGSVPK